MSGSTGEYYEPGPTHIEVVLVVGGRADVGHALELHADLDEEFLELSVSEAHAVRRGSACKHLPPFCCCC